MSFRIFWIKPIIFSQNRVHRINTSQIMSTRIKNEFQIILDQNRYFQSKPSLLGWYRSKKYFLVFEINFLIIKILVVEIAFFNISLSF
jgi:hypothetical protein